MRALVLAFLVACGGGEETSGGDKKAVEGDNKPAATPRDGVVEAWKKAGLKPSELAAASVAFGKDCQSGTVNDVDVILCNYASPAEAKKAEAATSEWMKDAPTATSFVAGTVLVAVADRKKADPNGKTINQMMKTASK